MFFVLRVLSSILLVSLKIALVYLYLYYIYYEKTRDSIRHFIVRVVSSLIVSPALSRVKYNDQSKMVIQID